MISLLEIRVNRFDMRNTIFKIFGVILFVILGIAVFFYVTYDYVSTDDARVKIANIYVVSEVPGYVTAINFTANTFVHADDTIIEIDKERYIIENKKSEAGFNYFQNEYERKSKLSRNTVISEEELDKAKYDFEVAKALFAKTQYDLDRASVKAKTDGILTNFDIKIGDFISEGRNIYNIINKSDIWIEANYKEADIEHIKSGQDAVIEIDSFSRKKWHAKVVSVAPATLAEFSILPAQNSSGNWIKVPQRIAVRLEFTEGQDLSRLSSGMSLYVKIKIK